MGGANQLDDVAAQLWQEQMMKQTHRGTKPGILLNEQMDAETKLLKKAKTTFRTEQGYPPEKEDEQLASDEEESHDGKLRRRTVMRKEQKLGDSDIDHSDASWAIYAQIFLESEYRDPTAKKTGW